MLEELFRRRPTLARQTDAPYLSERTRYLRYCVERGDSRATVLCKARELLWVARKLNVDPTLGVTTEQLESVARGWRDRQRIAGQKLDSRWTRARFIEVARPRLRYLGWWREPVMPIPFQNQVEDYCRWMKEARGLSKMTIDLYRRFVGEFLRWYGPNGRTLSEVQATDIDRHLAEAGASRWSRRSVHSAAGALRSFFRYGATEGWAPPELAQAIQGPRLYSEESLPAGPAWSDVQRMLADMRSDYAQDVRDRAIVMLLAIYGLRVSEVTTLRLEDLDWERDLLHVARAKRRERQSYPLLPSVGSAIIQYLQTVRRSSTHREVFLTLHSPFRPLSRSALYSMVCQRLTRLGIRTAHRGPHSLRHACAARLVAEGLTLKEIGDHLGHRSASSTRIYAKVDLPGLREVAAFDLGELL
jgi:site-specific recombinase XerD